MGSVQCGPEEIGDREKDGGQHNSEPAISDIARAAM
jgi:hypothetical protein